MLLDALRDTLEPLWHPCQSMVPRTRSQFGFRIPAFGVVFYVRAHSDDIYTLSPWREQDVHTAILDALAPGGVLVDVGANVGYYSVLGGRRVGRNGLVVAVDAVLPTVEQLRRNVAANELANVRVIHAAASAANGGTVSLSVPEGRFGTAGRAEPSGATQLFEAPAVTIDSLCAALTHVDVLKIDVEGAELSALRGAEQTLRRTRVVVVECDHDADAIESLLRSHGFEITPLSFGTYRMAVRGRAASEGDEMVRN